MTTENTCGITGIKMTLFREAKMFHYKTVQAMSFFKGQKTSFACLAHLSFPQHPITHHLQRKAAGAGGCLCGQGDPRAGAIFGHTDPNPSPKEAPRPHLGPREAHTPPKENVSVPLGKMVQPNKKRKYTFQLQKN